MRTQGEGLSVAMQGRLFLRSLCLQSCWSFERMQSLGLAYCLEPWLRKCYGGRRAEFRQAELRQLGFFNTQPYMAALVMGMVCALEEAAAGLPAEERQAAVERLGQLKMGAASALAGIGDALFWGTLKPFCAALALAAGFTAWRLGGSRALLWMPAAYLAVYNLPAIALRWRGIRWGYEWRDQIALKLKEFPWQAWIRRLRLAGLVLALGLCVLMLWSAPGPGASGTFGPRSVGVVMLAAYILALGLFPAVLSTYRIYAATCALGGLAAAAGWL